MHEKVKFQTRVDVCGILKNCTVIPICDTAISVNSKCLIRININDDEALLFIICKHRSVRYVICGCVGVCVSACVCASLQMLCTCALFVHNYI